jgi:hypothetical protein
VLWPKVARVGENRAPPVPGEPRALLGLGGFEDSGVVFSVLGLRGLSTFGDSLSTRAVFVEESGVMS